MDYAVLVSCVLAVILYLNTLGADFAYDDSRAIQKNPDLVPKTPLVNLFYNDFWGTPLTHPGSHKSYRPLCVLTFRLNYFLGELNPWGYHLGNVLCHAITTGVFTHFFARTILRKDLATLTAGAIFASHPVHTEAVAGIVGRADVMACCFFVLTVVAYMSYVQKRDGSNPNSRWLSAISVLALAAAGLLTKEQALTSLAVCAVYDVFVWSRATVKDVLTLNILRDKRFWPSLEGLGILTVFGSVLLVFRICFMGNKPPDFAPSDNPASDSDSLLTRCLTYLHLSALNAWLLLCPNVLSFDWSMEAIPLLESVSDLRNVITLLFYASLVYVIFLVAKNLELGKDFSCHFSGSKKNRFSSDVQLNNNNATSLYHHKQNGSHNSNGHGSKLKKYQSSVTHLQQNSSKFGDDVCEDSFVPYRHVDVMIIALAIIAFPFIPASNMFFYVGFVIAERILYIPSMGFCLLVGQGVQNIYERLENDTKRKSMYAVLCFLLLCFSAKTILRNGDWQNEERLYSSGIKVNPAKGWGNLANIYNEKNESRKAEAAYRNALIYRPNMADVHYNLGILLQNQGRTQESVESYQNAIKFRPKLSVAYLNLAILKAQLGEREAAKSFYAKCADLDTSNLKDPRLHDGTKISCLFNHGRLMMDDENYEKALSLFETALKRRPDHYAPHSIYNMIGELYFKQDNIVEAEKWYREAYNSKPDHMPAQLTMAKVLQAKGQSKEALEFLERAKKLSPNDRTPDIHKAQLFATSGRGPEALKIYDELLRHSNNDFETVYNAANVHREFGDPLKAEELYAKAVQLRPNEAMALMNLGAMYHMNKKYDEAEEAYLEALRLNPSNKVTRDNLQKLRSLKTQSKKGS